MILGLQLGLLPGGSLEKARNTFLALQKEVPLKACELHLDTSFSEAACSYWEDADESAVAHLRAAVDRLGVHLPFADTNPLSINPDISGMAFEVLEKPMLLRLFGQN